MPPLLHSELGASSAHRWIACPASVALSKQAALLEQKQKRVRPASRNAAEGTCAHEVCERLLKGEVTPDELRGKRKVVDKEEFVIDDEMLECAGIFIATVKGMAGDAELVVEQRFSLDWLYRGMFGTCDCVCRDKASRTIWVFDFKYGRGKAVFAKENPQLLYYALGVMGANNTDFDRIVMTIVQPRNPLVGIDTWECDKDYLYKWAFNTLLPAAKMTEREDAPYCPGDEQCRWCKGATICPALYEKTMEMAKDFFPQIVSETPTEVKEVVLPPATELTVGQLQNILDMAGVLTDYFSIVKEEAYERACRGVEVPGYKLVRGRTSRSWADENEAEKMLVDALGERAFEKKLISPAKAEKVVDKKQVSKYTQFSEGKLTLVAKSDKRKAVDPSEVFPHISDFPELSN